MEHYKRIDRKLSFKGHILDFYSDTIEIDGSKKAIFDFIKHRGASAMIPVDQDGRILMVRQYRNAIDNYSLEIPAGGLNPGEDNLTCAVRECEEETGYKALNPKHLIDIYTTVAFSNERISIFYTDDIQPSKQKLDEDEFLTIERLTLDEIVEMIYNGTIMDSKTIAGILAYKSKLI